jgi:Fe-S cluster biogenesis protein NfuA
MSLQMLLDHGTGRATMDARDKIEEVLDAIRPALRSDGGDVELIDYDEDDGIVQLRLMGACGSCPVSMMTLRQGIERRLMLAVPQVRGVHAL